MPPLEPPAASDWLDVVETLSVCGRRLRAALATALAAEQIGDAQFSLLWSCTDATSGGVSQRHVADALSVSPAHVSTTLEQLRRQGLMCSQRCATDRRRQLWVVTPAGCEVVQRIESRLKLWATQLDQELGPQVSRELQRILQALIGAAKQVESQDQEEAERDSASPPTQRRAA